MAAVALKQIVGANIDKDIAVADWTAIRTGFALALHSQSNAVINAGWDRNGQFGLIVLQAGAPASAAGMLNLLPRAFAGRAGRLHPQDAS